LNGQELTGKYPINGRKVDVEGRLEHRSCTDLKGREREAAEIIAGDVQFLDSKRDATVVPASADGGEVDPSEIPF
jgi:single-stranded DNA-binding protein